MKNSVKEWRQAAGWSQEQLAERLGVTRLTVISIEKGRFDPSLPLAFRIAKAFESQIEELFDPDESQTSR